ncbi:MAG TPA: HNH endonuclease signature motif containing protein, partial [Iamia sp.]|nr:HNH endonuclease signature motif containing protein [Iamia sp.]
YPGCDRPAHTTDGHHIQHWIDHGQTAPDNLVLLCRRHHQVIHRPGWTIELGPDTTVTVTTPDGRRRTSHPPDPAILAA